MRSWIIAVVAVVAVVAAHAAVPAAAQPELTYNGTLSNRLYVGDGRYHVYTFKPGLMPDTRVSNVEVLLSWQRTTRTGPQGDMGAVMTCIRSTETLEDAAADLFSFGEDHFMRAQVGIFGGRTCHLLLMALGVGVSYVDYYLNLPTGWDLKWTVRDGQPVSSEAPPAWWGEAMEGALLNELR